MAGFEDYTFVNKSKSTQILIWISQIHKKVDFVVSLILTRSVGGHFLWGPACTTQLYMYYGAGLVSGILRAGTVISSGSPLASNRARFFDNRVRVG